MPIAKTTGQSINYTDSGGGPPVLSFSHGFFLDLTMFDAQVAALSGTCRCIAWDERGFGGTPVTGPFTYWDSADDAVALLDHLGIDQAVFVGMSQGGFLSLRAALTHRDRVRAIVLIGSESGVNTPEEITGYEEVMAHWQSGEPLGDVGDLVGNLVLGDPELIAKWQAIWDARDRSTVAYPAQTLLSREDITHRLGQIRCPVLLIHGEDDQANTMDKAKVIEAALPDCRGLVRIDGAGHAPNMTHPETVNAAIQRFVSGL